MKKTNKKHMVLFMSALAYHLKVNLVWLMEGTGDKGNVTNIKIDINAEALAEVNQGLLIAQIGVTRAEVAMKKISK